MMIISRRRWGWKLELARILAVGGVIASGDCGLAQIKPDSTLGPESSSVTRNVLIKGLSSDQIDGGARRGANLFHSFQDFNVNEGRGAYFTNPTGIENILSRVTGGNHSDIQGALGVLGNANLFLINPNGIIFGPSASLDVNGSFVGTTANAIRLTSGDIFNTNPGESLPNQLLNVNPNAFLFNQIAAQPIINRSIANLTGLQVPQGRSLLLVGGDVRLEGGRLFAPGGHVELGGLAGTGTVDLSVNGSDLRSSFPDGVQRADVSLINGASLNVLGGDGSITINAQNLGVLGSSLLAGILPGTFEPGAQAGDIEINAMDRVKIEGKTNAPSSIVNIVGDLTGATALGSAGDIVVNTGSLNVIGNASIGSATNGRGNAGSLTIQAKDRVSFVGSNIAAVSAVGPLGEGNGADINIQARSLSLSDGAQLITSTLGQGNAGNIQVNATDSASVSSGSVLQTSSAGQGNAGNVTITAGDTVSFDGTGANGLPSSAFSAVLSVPGLTGDRKGGNINIQAGSLSLTNGAQLNSSTYGQGNAGDINIAASGTVSFDGFPSGALSFVRLGAVGKGGDINIRAESLSLTNGAQLNSSMLGQGNAGNIQVNATDSVSVSSGSVLGTVTSGRGNAGDINIVAGGTVSFDGVGTFFIGEEFRSFPSAATSSVGRTLAIDVGGIPVPELVGIGEGGDINIRAESLSLTDSAVLSSSTLGVGDAGSISVQVDDSVSLMNGFIASSVEPSGVGNAGNIEVVARSIRLDNQASLSSNTTGGQGNIILRSEDLVLRRGSNITTNATGTATGGNINIDTSVLAALEDSDISADALEGPGGRVIIDAQGIFGTEFREDLTPQSDITATSNLGPQFSGTVELNTPDVDPSQGLVALPVVLVNTEVVQACTPSGSQAKSEFVVTGRGGLPPSPNELLSSDAVQVDWVTLNPGGGDSSSPAVSGSPTAPKSASVVEAQGWAVNRDGEVVLTASAASAQPRAGPPSDECRAPQLAPRD